MTDALIVMGRSLIQELSEIGKAAMLCLVKIYGLPKIKNAAAKLKDACRKMLHQQRSRASKRAVDTLSSDPIEA